MTEDEKKGYRQALLDVACVVCLAEHTGELWSDLNYLWQRAGLGEIPDGESGEVDLQAIEAMGGRPCHQVPDMAEHTGDS